MYKSSEKPIIKLHENVPVGGKGVDCETATKIFLVIFSVDYCLLSFFGVFSGDFGFLYSRSTPDLLLLLNYFLSVSQWVFFS